MPDSARGSTPLSTPGFSPVPWTDEPPSAQAVDRRARSSGGSDGGWNRKAVVTTLAPLARMAHTSSSDVSRGM